MLMRKVLSVFVITMLILLAIAYAQPKSVQLPNGSLLSMWLKNHKGEDTNEFHPGDSVVVTFYSGSAYEVKVDAWLIYPENKLPMRQLADKLTISSTGGETRPPELEFQLSSSDPEGTYAVRIRVYNEYGNKTLGEVDLIFTFTTKVSSESLFDPFLIVAIAAIALVAVMLVILVIRKTRFSRPPAASEVAISEAPQVEETVVADRGTIPLIALAKLEGPGGKELIIADVERIFGRSDFEQFLPWDAARTISRRHFRIFYRAGKWYVEDLNSTNGTMVNGEDIRGKGPRPVKDGDVISPAGVVNLVFREMGPAE